MEDVENVKGSGINRGPCQGQGVSTTKGRSYGRWTIQMMLVKCFHLSKLSLLIHGMCRSGSLSGTASLRAGVAPVDWPVATLARVDPGAGEKICICEDLAFELHPSLCRQTRHQGEGTVTWRYKHGGACKRQGGAFASRHCLGNLDRY